MFRNIRFYQMQGEWPDSEAALSEKLAAAAFEPCGSYSERSAGWEAPVMLEGESPLCRRVAGADLLQLRLQTRILPPAAVREALVERVEVFRARTGREPARAEKRELKEDVYSNLLPKALLKSERIRGFFLRSEAVLAIETTSSSKAELFLEALREAFGSLPVVPLGFARPIGELLTRIFLGDGPREFLLGRECRMVDPTAGAASVNWLDMDLGDRSVQQHVRSGLKLDRLGVGFEGLLTCVLDQEAVIRKLRFEGQDSVDDLPDEDPIARLDTEFVMLTGSVSRLLGALAKRLGGYAG